MRSESDSNLCSNFEFCDEKTILIHKAKQFMMTKRISKKSLHILDDGASGVQVGDIKQAGVYNLF